MKLKRNDGFTLIEVIVVAGIIAVLAGILVPIIFKEIDESKKTRAAADVKSISSAMMVLKKDTGQWPINATCMPGSALIAGTGTFPTFAGAGWTDAPANSFTEFLSKDDNACWPTTWKGPYIASVTADPWGRAYVVNADAFMNAANPPVWIISAGPDGIVQTGAADDAVANDDIGVRLQ